MMLVEYLRGALAQARYEKIRDREPFYAEIPAFRGVWATGKTREGCRRKLAEALEGWLLVRLRKGLPLPKVKGVPLKAAHRMSCRA